MLWANQPETLALFRRSAIYGLLKAQQQRLLYWRWLAIGKSPPTPHLVKQKAIRQAAASRRDIRTLVETGTYLGEMVHAMRNEFRTIYSIELSESLHALAQQRFAGTKHIFILLGDSGKVLEQVLAETSEPCLFWLDGHFSGGVTARGELETPIEKELNTIARHCSGARHVILIDDARSFSGTQDYPTLNELRAWAAASGYDEFTVRDDIVRISRSTDAG